MYPWDLASANAIGMLHSFISLLVNVCFGLWHSVDGEPELSSQVYIELRRSLVISDSFSVGCAVKFYADCACNANGGTIAAVEYYVSS